MTFLLAIGAIVVVAIVVGAIAVGTGAMALGRAAGNDAAASNQIVPGIDSGAPANWFGAHSPEAILHRRLRDAVAAMRDNPTMEDPSIVGVRGDIEQEAIAIDQRLIAVARLPEARRSERMAQVAAAVEQLEGLVADAIDTAATPTTGGIEAVRTRLDLIGQARREIAETSSGSMQAMRDVLDAADRPADAPEAEPGTDQQTDDGGTPEPGTSV